MKNPIVCDLAISDRLVRRTGVCRPLIPETFYSRFAKGAP